MCYTGIGSSKNSDRSEVWVEIVKWFRNHESFFFGQSRHFQLKKYKSGPALLLNTFQLFVELNFDALKTFEIFLAEKSGWWRLYSCFLFNNLDTFPFNLILICVSLFCRKVRRAYHRSWDNRCKLFFCYSLGQNRKIKVNE